jgi:hypothetical protein
VKEKENLNQENGRGRRRVREREILKKKIGRERGLVGERKKKNEREGEYENTKQNEGEG